MPEKDAVRLLPKHSVMDVRNSIVSQLAKFLRINGDKVISGNCKLSLTTYILCLLNNFFDAILFPVTTGDSTLKPDELLGTELYEDTKFLFDFMKKTSSLKIIHGAYTLRGGVDLSHFSNLRVIELHKVPMHLIIGLSDVSSQIKALICHRSICYLKEIFANCVVDDNYKDVWLQLKELNVAYNYMDRFDQSLGMLPSVEHFDASYNRLRDVQEIQVLEKLIFLNLSFNMLESIPVLSGLSCYSLRSLYIRNNVLEDLDGLEMLVSLHELDVSYNCLSEHSTLRPLKSLHLLKSLYLEGNPLFFHERHQELTVAYIHPSVKVNGFSLDGEALVFTELEIPDVGNKERCRDQRTLSVHQTAINVIVDAHDDSLPEVDRNYAFVGRIDSLPDSVEASIQKYEDSLEANIKEVGTLEINRSAESLQKSSEKSLGNEKPSPKAKKKKPKHRMKEVQILEPDEHIPSQPVKPSADSLQEVPADVPPHIVRKKMLEARKKEYKEEWLVPTEGFRTLLVSGDESTKVPPNTPVATGLLQAAVEGEKPLPWDSSSQRQVADEQDIVSPCSTVERFEVPPNTPVASSLQASAAGGVACQSSAVEKCRMSAEVLGRWIEEQNSFFLEESENSGISTKIRRPSEVSDDIEVLKHTSAGQQANSVLEADLVHGYASSNTYEYEYTSSDSSIESDIDPDYDMEKNTFLVEKTEGKSSQSVFLRVAKMFVTELDSSSAKKVDVLDLRTLISAVLEECTKENSVEYQVKLSFDSAKTSRQKRLYVFDEKESAQDFISKMKPYVDARSYEDSVVGALKCLKCHSQFSKEVACRKAVKAENPFPKAESVQNASKDLLKETDACPNCGSTIVVELEVLPVRLSKASGISAQVEQQTVGQAVQQGDFIEAGVKGSKLGDNSPSARRREMLEGSHMLKNKVSPNYLDADNEVPSPAKSVQDSHPGLSDFQSPPALPRNSSEATVISNQSSIAVISDSESGPDAVPESDKPNINLADSSTATGNCNQDANEESDLNNATLSDTDVRSRNVAGEEVEEVSVTESSDFKSLENVYGSSGGTSDDSGFLRLLSVKENIDSEIFTSVDHRLKLYLEVYTFKEDESFQAYLNAPKEMNSSSSGSRPVLSSTTVVQLSNLKEVEAVLVISNQRLFIMTALQEYSDVFNKNMETIHVAPLKNLHAVNVLLGSQGFSLTFGPDGKVFVCLVRDADLCNSFISTLTEITNQRLQEHEMPKFIIDTEKCVAQVYSEIIQPVAHENENQNECKQPEILLHLLAFFHAEGTKKKKVCIVVTPDDIFLSDLNFKKVAKGTEVQQLFQYKLFKRQNMVDLTSVRLGKDFLDMELLFESETSDGTTKWLISTATKSSLISFITALKGPWEVLFGTSLPLHHPTQD